MAQSNDRIRFQSESAGDVDLSRARTHTSLPDAKNTFSEKDIEGASSAGVWQIEERDVKHKQVFKGWLLLWCAS